MPEVWVQFQWKRQEQTCFDLRVCTFEIFARLGFGRVFSDLTENLEVFEPNFEVGKRNNSLSPTTFYTETLQCLLWKVVHFAATTDQDIAPSTVEKSKKMQHTVKKIVDHFAATTEDISPMQLWLDKSSNQNSDFQKMHIITLMMFWSPKRWIYHLQKLICKSCQYLSSNGSA